MQTLQHRFRIPFKEADQVQIADNQHHGKKQDDRGKIDEVQSIGGACRAAGNHRYRANNRCTRPVDLETRKFADRENQVAAEKDDVSGDLLRIGKRCRRNQLHAVAA